MIENYGGNQIYREIEKAKGLKVLAHHRYFYGLIKNPGDFQELSKLNFQKSVCHVYEGSAKLQGETVSSGSYYFIEKSRWQIQLLEPCFLFVAGMIEEGAIECPIKKGHIQIESQLKFVKKPWGYEIWITGEDPDYCFKKIGIQAGTRTSLQFHERKRETNLIVSGQAKFIYKKNSSVENLKVQPQDLSETEIQPITVIDVEPLCLHRIESMTDLLLFEVSTPEVDDVIRVSDDSGRTHGRIREEHTAKKS